MQPTPESSPEYGAMLDMEAAQIYSNLKVSAEHERLDNDSSAKPKAVVLGEQRSFPNVRNSIRKYLQWRTENGASPARVSSELDKKTSEVKDKLIMAYYAKFANAKKVIDAGALKNLFEFSGTEQDARKKAAEISINDALVKRMDVDQALGWEHPEKIYHLAVEPSDAGHDPEGPSGNYGAIRFVFDFESLADSATFTEGDSLNPGQLPDSLSTKRGDYLSASRGVENRQISKEHVPIAQAILNLSTELEDKTYKTAKFLRYIEAQIGTSGTEIMNSLRGIEIDLDESFEEARNDRLLYVPEKEKELYQKYFKKKPGGPNPFPDFDNPAPPEPIDMDSYNNEAAELRWSNFLTLISQVREFCEGKNVDYKQRGDLEKLKERCVILTKRSAF